MGVVLLGRAILFGLLPERLTRRIADEKEKRRLLLSSPGLSFPSGNRVEGFSGVAVIAVEVLDRPVLLSGSCEASRGQGADSVREREACIRHHISMSTSFERRNTNLVGI